MPQVKRDELSDKQRQQIRLYKKAFGYAIVWKNKAGQFKVLDPSEISIINNNNLVDLITSNKKPYEDR